MTSAHRPGLAPRLAALDSCAVSDALDRLGLAGAALGLHGLTVAKKIAGPVVTVRLDRADGRRSDRHLGTGAIEAADRGDIIVVAASGLLDAGGWGGVLSHAAVLRGVAGVIVDGACRDIDEARQLNLPVYGRAGTVRTARGRLIEVAMNEPVVACGVRVRPGDLVLADGSGVVFVPGDRAADVLAAAERIAAREQAMIARIASGEPVSRVMSRDYETLLEGDGP